MNFKTKTAKFAGKLILLIGLILVMFVIGSILLSTMSVDSLTSLRASIDKFSSWWFIVRVSFIALLYFKWREINVYLSKKNEWSEEHLERVLAGRKLMVSLLIFVELIMVQRVHEYVFNF